MTEPPPTPRPPTLLEALVPVAALILLVGLSFLLFGDAGAEGPNQVALAVATMVAVLVATVRPRFDDVARGAYFAALFGLAATLVLFFVGAQH